MRAGTRARTTIFAAFLAGCGQDTFGTVSDAAPSDAVSAGDATPSDADVDAMTTADCGDPQTSPENCGACGHSCLGGDCDAGTCLPVLLGTSTSPHLIAVDDVGIYWTDSFTDGGVIRADKDGRRRKLLIAQAGAEAIAVRRGEVYYSAPNTIGVIPLDGGVAYSVTANVKTPDLAVGDARLFGTNAGVVTGVTSYDLKLVGMMSTPNQGTMPSGIAIDAKQVYFALAPGEIRAITTAGLVPVAAITGQSDPEGVAADGTFVFWTNNTDGSVKRASTTLATSVAIATTQNNPHRLALDNKNVYWANGGGTIMRVDKQGGSAPIFLFSGPPGPRGIAVDDEAVYWTNDLEHTVMKVAKPIH